MCSIVPSGFSDHSLVLCNVFIQNISPSAYWHFNSVLAFAQLFKEVLMYFWDAFRQRKVLGSGGTMVRLRLNIYVNSTPSTSPETSPDL